MSDTKKNESSGRRSEIVALAMELFLQDGFSGTSMSTVAKASGISKASLYHHFPSKEALFVACVTEGYGTSLDELRVIVTRDDKSPADKMRMAIDALYRSSINSPVGRMSPLIAEVSRSFPNVARAFHQDYIAPQEALVGEILDEGIASGQFRDVDKLSFFHQLLGPIVTLSLSREMFATFDDLDEQFPVQHLQQHHTEACMRHLLIA